MQEVYQYALSLSPLKSRLNQLIVGLIVAVIHRSKQRCLVTVILEELCDDSWASQKADTPRCLRQRHSAGFVLRSEPIFAHSYCCCCCCCCMFLCAGSAVAQWVECVCVAVPDFLLQNFISMLRTVAVMYLHFDEQ